MIGLEPVHLWADEIYVKGELEKDTAALRDCRKVVLAIEADHRESAAACSALLRGLRNRGLAVPWLLIADGHLGIWAAVAKVFPEIAEQRCWNHKLLNFLDRLPRRLQAEARALRREIPYASTREEVETLRDRFGERYGPDHPAAAETLVRDWQRRVTFYDFPKEHWKHLRTIIWVESPFAAVSLRTNVAKGYKRVANFTAFIWRLLLVTEKTFRRLDHPEVLPQVALGARYRNGERIIEEDQSTTDQEVAA